MYGPMLSVINLLAVFTQIFALQLLCGNATDMWWCTPNSPEILEYHDVYELFEINRLIVINFWQLIDL